MLEKNNFKEKKVIANLVGTYDLSPEGASSVKDIDFLCIYEYEYEGKKYKYRAHKTDTFEPISETLELGFIKKPTDVYIINNSTIRNNSKTSSSKKFFVLLWSFLILVSILVIYGIYKIFKFLFDLEINIPFLLIFIVLYIVYNAKQIKIQKYKKNRDALIEDAMLNNRTATAHLVKTWHYSINVVSTPTLQQIYKTYPYEGKYTYSYNGKKYTKKFKFMSNPPSSIRIFFNKNPKDII